MTKQSYKYKKYNSILSGQADEYVLSETEYFLLYNFFVTYSMCDHQSEKKRTFIDYGWNSNKIKNTDLGNALNEIINFNKNSFFVFTEENDLAKRFNDLQLTDGNLDDLNNERAVISKTSDQNKYLKLFHRLRNCLAHGKYVLKFSSQREKMLICQDNDQHNVTARIVIKLSTLLTFVNVIDRNNIIVAEHIENTSYVA